MSTKTVGDQGEARGIAFLRENGYRIVECNYRSAFGEIDVIARDNDTLVFVEIKSRNSASFGLPQEAVDRRKQSRIIKSALHYLKLHRLSCDDIRFDVVAVRPDLDEVEIIRSAFTSSGHYTI